MAGVIQVSVDAETGTVKVLGYADPATLLKKLKRAGKIAELLATERVDIGGENSEDSGDSEDEYSCSKTTTSTSAASSSSRRHYLHSPPPYWPPPTTYEPSPAPALPPAANSFEHYFSDENAANGCFIIVAQFERDFVLGTGLRPAAGIQSPSSSHLPHPLEVTYEYDQTTLRLEGQRSSRRRGDRKQTR
ncbi:hypothetical protein AXF42_Ash006520 [Apostasia shenzhenica]|uniref:HMA domain-containing protein n=1 Tax=Apostasia shenzhenica TaxID=1088818 RepID=A0A2I0AZC6_9ASPA|nr:hypothetical protein AXF42_Ash006520 [Apostasia shenzhenica]